MSNAECTSFKTDNLDWDGPGTPAVAGGFVSPSEHERLDFSDIPIEDAAHLLFVDRDPVEAADYYGQDDVEVLIDMLNDPENADYRQTIMGLIAIISDGAEAHAGALSELADSNDVALRGAALTGLGMVASRGSDRALEVLLARANAADEGDSDAARVGLGLSGNPRARAALMRMRGQGVGRRNAVVEEALSINDQVSQNGLRGYFGR